MTQISDNNSAKEINPLLKFGLEMGPLVVFFLGNARGKQLQAAFPVLEKLGEPIFVATALFMLALTLAVSVSYYLTRSLPIMPMVTLGFVLVMGGLTLWLQNDTFIKMKPTLNNILFGAALLIGLKFGRNFLMFVFDSAFALNRKGWDILAIRWAFFFFFLAALNEIVWRNFSTDFWVNFKVWGTLPITMIFGMAQMPMLQRYPPDETGPDETGPDEAKEDPQNK